MKYVLIKSGLKLHIAFEFTDYKMSPPICGVKANSYSMSINVPLARACKNCLRVTDKKIKSLRTKYAQELRG